jgi:hypothetical protein
MTVSAEHRTERFAHSIYGLIVLTAAVGELRALEEDFTTAAIAIAGAFVVLVVAHGYSEAVANTVTHDRLPKRSFVVATALDQLAIATPAAVAISVLALSQTELITLTAAYDVVVAAAIVVLALAGVAIGRHHNLSVARTIAVATANVALGVLIISIEAFASH